LARALSSDDLFVGLSGFYLTPEALTPQSHPLIGSLPDRIERWPVPLPEESPGYKSVGTRPFFFLENGLV
jgi:hypothetical protein